MDLRGSGARGCGFKWIYMDFLGFKWIYLDLDRFRRISRLAAASQRLGAPKEMVLGCWVPGAWKLGYWRLGSWRLGGYQACRPRLGGLALIGVIAGLVVV